MGYNDSQVAQDAAHLRKVVRATDRLTKTQKLVLVEIVNQWAHHRNYLGFIYPGRDRLARKCVCSVDTVRVTLALLRTSGVLIAVQNAKGEGQKRTRYIVDPVKIFPLCGVHIPETVLGDLVPISARDGGVKSATTSATKSVTTGGGKSATDRRRTLKGKVGKKNSTKKPTVVGNGTLH